MNDHKRAWGDRGEQSGTSKLTETQVRDIKRRLADGERIIDVAEAFGVAVSTVHSIKSRRTWRHVTLTADGGGATE